MACLVACWFLLTIIGRKRPSSEVGDENLEVIKLAELLTNNFIGPITKSQKNCRALGNGNERADRLVKEEVNRQINRET